MVPEPNRMSAASPTLVHEWTERKLEIITGYLQSYCTALKNKNFSTTYIDAFAGTGYRSNHPQVPRDGSELLFPELAEAAPQKLLDGSARRALTCEPPFDRYDFVELDPERAAELRHLEREFPNRRITVHEGDANEKVPSLCARDWHGERARGVVFLDPYGMQVKWATIEAIAATQALDLWVLFPLGVAVNRLVTRSRQFPAGWRESLNRILGTTDWDDAFYQRKVQKNLLGGHYEHVEKVSVNVVGAYLNERLRTRFAAVAQQPAVLRNSVGNPIYLLCFAVANPEPKAHGLALRIANHLLQGLA